LEQESAGPELILTADGSFEHGQKDSKWSVTIQGLNGYVCHGQAGFSTLHLPDSGPHDYYLFGASALSAIAGSPFVTIKLCWKSGAPLVISGAYVSADLPAVLAPLGQSGTVTRVLVLGHPPMSSYIPAGGVLPAVASGQGWFWSSDISDSLQSQSRFDIPVTASSLPGLEHANRLSLYSGIFFGIAGGALVAVLPAFIEAADRRKAEKKPRREAGSLRSAPRNRRKR
jgi:hypothetical protein